MLLGNFNIIGFYSSKSQRIWDNTDIADRYSFMAFLPTHTIPAVQLIVESSQGATLQLLDNNDNPVGSPIAMTIEDHVTEEYSRLIYLGGQNLALNEGYYSLKVVNGAETYYSDVFGWRDDLTGFLKVEASQLGDFNIGEYQVNSTGMTYECYYSAEYSGLTPDISEEAEENNGHDTILSGSRTLVRKFTIEGYEYVYEFISALRILSANGNVVITWLGREYSATDIEVETDEDLVEGCIYLISLKFKTGNQTISTNNSIDD